MKTTPKYTRFPPLTPHKPDTELEKLLAKAAKKSMTDAEIAAQRQSWMRGEMGMGSDAESRAYFEPTPTIPQMEDRHERQVFTCNAERVVNKVLAFALTVLAVVFVGGLMYKTFVWGY